MIIQNLRTIIGELVNLQSAIINKPVAKFKRLELTLDSPIPAGGFINFDLTAPQGRMWDVKFVSATLTPPPGSVGKVSFRIFSGSTFTYSQILTVEGERIDMRAYGFEQSRGHITLPEKFVTSDVVELQKYISDTFFVGDVNGSRIRVQNDSDKELNTVVIGIHYIEQ